MRISTLQRIVLFCMLIISISFAASAQYAALDSSFGSHAIAYDSFPGGPVTSSIKVLNNDKIIALGFNSSSPTNKFVLARYTANGALDSTFSTNGWLIDSIPAVTGLSAVTVLLQYDSMIIVTGGFTYVNSSHDTSYLWAMRFKPNGQIDNTFGTAGLAKLSLKGIEGGYNYNPGTGALQPDSKILVGGAVETGTYQENDFALVRFTANGAVDNTFGTGGRSVIPFTIAYQFNSGGDFLTSLVVEPSGRIIAGGFNYNAYNPQGIVAGDYVSELACYKPNGTLDSSFAGTGKIMFGEFSGRITSLGLQSNGTVVAAGYNNYVDPYAQLFFVDTTGATPAYTDDYIANNGLQDYFYTEYNTCYVTPNNKVIAAGYTSSGYINNVYTGAYDDIIRFQPNGYVDTFFNNYHQSNNGSIGGGWALLNLSPTGVTALGLQSTGKIIAAGSPNFTIARIFPSLDTMDCSDYNVVAQGRTYVCTSDDVDTFTVSMYNVGANPVYHWYKNGAAVGSNSPTYIVNGIANGDSVWVSVSTTVNCVGSLAAKSNVIHVSVTPAATVLINADTNTCINYYHFHGQSLTASGIYTDTAIGLNGCDSITVLALNYVSIPYDTVRAAICMGDSFQSGGYYYKNAGTFSYFIMSVNGCDSFTILKLKVLGTNDTVTQNICTGAGYNFHGRILTAAGTYHDTLTSVVTGCDSIKTLVLTTSPVIYSNAGGFIYICSGASYNFNGRVLTAGGSYSDTLTSAGGCDSIVTIYLTVSNSVTSYLSQHICPGSSYVFHGHTLSTDGTYYDTLTASTGCDSIVTLFLSVMSPITTSLSQSICAGGSFQFGGHTLTAAGTYRDTLASAYGCDSVLVLTLSISAAQQTYIVHSMIAGSSYVFGGHTLTAAGTYRDTLTAMGGCDSILILQLVTTGSFPLTASAPLQMYPWCMTPPVPIGVPVAAIGGSAPYTYAVNSGSYQSSNVLSVTGPGIYTIHVKDSSGTIYSFSDTIAQQATWNVYDTVTNAGAGMSNGSISVSVSGAAAPITYRWYSINGQIPSGSGLAAGFYYVQITDAQGMCDTTLYFHVGTGTTCTNVYAALTASACGSYTIGTHHYTTSGTYTDTLATAAGCDSIVTLTLSISNVLTTSIAQGICAGSSYSFGGHTLTSTGTYHDTLTTSGGCDSIVTLSLTVSPVYRDSQQVYTCNSYTFHGQLLTTSGTYRDTLTASTGCDSIMLLFLVVHYDSHDTISRSICIGDTVLFGGAIYDAAGYYSHTFISSNDCDSFSVLHLTVNPLPVVTLSWDSLVTDYVLMTMGTAFGYPLDTIWCSFNGPYTFAAIGGSPAGGIYTGTFLSHDTFNIYTYTNVKVDTVFYTYTNSNGCKATAIDSFGIEACEGVNDISAASLISLYPNPNKGTFTLSTVNGPQSTNSFTITDMLGNVIAQQNITSNTQTIDMHEAAEGVYTLAVKGAVPIRFVVVR